MSTRNIDCSVIRYVIHHSTPPHHTPRDPTITSTPSLPHHRTTPPLTPPYQYLLSDGARIWVIGHTIGDPNGYWIGSSSQSGGVAGPPTAADKWMTHERGATEWIHQPSVSAIKPSGASAEEGFLATG